MLRRDKIEKMAKYVAENLGRPFGSGKVIAVTFREYDNGHWSRDLETDHPGKLCGGAAWWVGERIPQPTGRILQFAL